jgi:hypothetical protein
MCVEKEKTAWFILFTECYSVDYINCDEIGQDNTRTHEVHEQYIQKISQETWFEASLNKRSNR